MSTTTLYTIDDVFGKLQKLYRDDKKRPQDKIWWEALKGILSKHGFMSVEFSEVANEVLKRGGL